MDVRTLTELNASRWKVAKIAPGRELEVERVAAAIAAPHARQIYEEISQRVWNTPKRWWFVGIVHHREASGDFSKSIAQGDPWNKKSVNVPVGLGPFASFIEAAVYTLTRVPVGGKYIPAHWTDWSIPGVLTLWIFYNGTGYEQYHHEPSPYDYGATTIEQRGKYVADHLFDASTWDKQIGCAALLIALIAIEPSIVEAPAANQNDTPQPKPELPAPPPVPAAPAAETKTVVVVDLYGLGGYATSPGMKTLAEEIAALGKNFIVLGPYLQDDWIAAGQALIAELKKIAGPVEIVLVGYSLGANNIVQLAAMLNEQIADLIGVQASVWGAGCSPLSPVIAISHNVHAALSIYNPEFFATGGLGYARYGAPAQLMTTADLHPAVDNDEGLHGVILNRLKKLAAS